MNDLGSGTAEKGLGLGAPGGGTPRIVAIEDETITRQMIQKVLSHSGFESHTAANGQEGLELIRTLKPDLVLLDLVLDRESGFDVCTEIRRTWSAQELPVVAVTGLEDYDSIQRAYLVGVNDYLTKPLHWKHLPHHLQHTLRAHQAVRELREQTQTLRSLYAVHPDPIFQININGVVTLVGHDSGQEKEACQIVGTLEDLLPEDLVRQVRERCGEAMASPTEVFTLEAIYSLDHRPRYWEARFVAAATDQVLVMVRDITERKNYERRIHHIAFHDSLTGLRNRHALTASLNRVFQDFQRLEGSHLARPSALLYLDLDNFKRINDTLGHALGDQLLKEVATRIADSLRPSDMVARADSPEDESVARIGGDEFCAVLTNLSSPMDAGKVAARILEALKVPIQLDGHDLVVTPSIGIALIPQDGRDADTILKNADRAMYAAKGGGRNRFEYFDATMGAQLQEHFAMEEAMRRALAHGMFRVHFQPQIDARSGAVTGMEALLRWEDPELGSLSPTKFIPVAEETGLILDLGEFVFMEALKFAKSLRAEGFPPIRVAVNLSSIQILDPRLVERIESCITLTGADPTLLEIEVTESVLMEGSDQALATIQRLKGLGITLALDDFGTGYSSLSYLHKFPFDILKIDQSFIRALMESPGNQSLVPAIIAMGQSLGMDLVAEGVEHLEQTNILLELGCNVAQGFLFGHPMSGEDFKAFVRERLG